MLNGIQNRKGKCSNICVGRGVSHRLMWSTKVYVDWEGETSALKKWNVDEVVILGLWGFNQRAVVSFRRVVNAASVAVDVLLSRSRSRLTFELSLTIL